MSAIAEKFEAIIKLGMLNSRMKDFYDIWLLSRQFNFESDVLSEAVRLTLKQRETSIPDEIEAVTDSFAAAKQAQWTAFLKKIQQPNVPTLFYDISSAVKMFLTPIITRPSTGISTFMIWKAPGPWV
ncbi:MAG: nucleotidyl transferase AbiEii/AbiGii toxin family protein [Desulfobacteraceae bacterium]|nr:nucleotidyl transferase AbiEii/AbiGii toxin family protein [Desulfobacteraceae bacterium]